MEQQQSENIESSQMNYIFEMFGKSMTQMLQQCLNQQIAIDELRAQLRANQNQISNITSTLEEFEDRLYVKIQEIRPTIYTRDGLTIDDALDLLTNKVNANTSARTAMEEELNRLDNEIKSKVDSESFENSLKDSHSNDHVYNEMSSAFQNIQKDLQKQQDNFDSLSQRVMEMVQVQVQTFITKSQLEQEDSEGPVTRKEFNETIEQLKKKGIFGLEDPTDLINAALSGDGPLDSRIQVGFNALKQQQDTLEALYNSYKEKINQNYSRLMEAAGDEDFSDSISTEDEFTLDFITENDEPREVRDAYCVASSTEPETISSQSMVPYNTHPIVKVTLRSIGIKCNIQSNHNNSPMENIKERIKEQASPKHSGQKDSSQNGVSQIDEHKLTNSITSRVTNKVETMLNELFSILTSNGTKIDPGDIKQLISQLNVLVEVKDSIQKLKILTNLKMDKADAQQELSIRVTREELYSMLSTLFPNNALLQKALSNMRKKQLPPLKDQRPSTPELDEKSVEEEKKQYVTNQRRAKTAMAANLVPGRNSRLLALNQKFLKGADGKYYLRDIGDSTSETKHMIEGTSTRTEAMTATPEAAFDYQPFLPASSLKSNNPEAIESPVNHQIKTPRD